MMNKASEIVENIALYGSLMREFPAQGELGILGQLEYIGECKLQGVLYSLGDWPCLVPGEGSVDGELYRILDIKVFGKLDPFEHFDPLSQAKSKYLRRVVQLIEPEQPAWAYVYNRPLNGEPHIEHGSWYRYVAEGNLTGKQYRYRA